MGALSLIGFGQPLVLLGLLSLPVLWWLLKATPPAPERVLFPPARLIFEMARREETPWRTPWWLLLLRLAIAALIVLGLAQPVFNPGAALPSSGPVVLIVNDGWAAADGWTDRVRTMSSIAGQARREDRNVILIRATADPDGGAPRARILSAANALSLIRAMQPRPWSPDMTAVRTALETAPLVGGANIFWLSDGLQREGGDELIEVARRLGTLTVLGREAGQSVMVLRSVAAEASRLRIGLERDDDRLADQSHVVLSASDGRVLLREPVAFEPGDLVTEASVTLPIEALNRVARVAIEGRSGAGAVALLDAGARRYRVGLSGSREPERDQPLLSDIFYLRRALGPFAEIREGDVTALLAEELSMLVMADVGQLVEADRLRLSDWIERGGVLVRFSGPRMAGGQGELLPVEIRRGGRTLQGAMSWARPAQLADFPDGSPFSGLKVPSDVTVHRQVLAEPSLDLPGKTWARLADGTPLVTAEARGGGWLVLVHTSANTAWSNLAISGLFVEMLRRLSALSSGIDVEGASRQLRPLQVLDGFGQSGLPGPSVRPINESDLPTLRLGPDHPPGLYGEEGTARAVNVGGVIGPLEPMGDLPAGVGSEAVGADEAEALGPWLLAAAAILLLVDILVALALRGMLRLRRPAGAAVLLLGLTALGASDPVQAQSGEADPTIMEAALETRLAFVLTGDDRVDRMSEAGLFGLTEILIARTSVEPSRAQALDVEADELIFYPVIYWPMASAQPALSDRAIRKVSAYLRTGGVILFDTRDDGSPLGSGGSAAPGTQRLRQLLGRIDIGPLDPVSDGHVLTKAFYLMDSFPGRHRGGRIWVERLESVANDGVSPLVIGGADWAAAWAMDRQGRPVAALNSGDPKQRELAYRFGVNLVMYALTGNYKADQVHVPAILERLGQ